MVRPLLWLAASLPMLLAACVDQRSGAAFGNHPLFAIACTDLPPAEGAGQTPSAPAVIAVSAREIIVTSRPPGAELSWAGPDQAAEPVRTYIPPGQRCSIYRTF
jgi:hypothetical protein